MSELKLPKSEVIRLIAMYKKKECLWNASSSFYKRPDLKQKAWEELAKEFKTNADIIKRKIKFLRTSFSAEKRKVDASMKPGSSGDVYVPTLFYFKELSFMTRSKAVRESVNNISSEPTSKSVSVNRPQADREIIVDVPPAKKVKQNNTRESLAPAVPSMNGTPAPGDMYAAFGNSIAMQLMQLPILEATKAMANIQQLVSQSITNNIMKNLHPCLELSTPVSFCYNEASRQSKDSEPSSQGSPPERKWHTY